MSLNDELGQRIKENYEQIPKTRLMRRTPVMLRYDGKAFHTLTKGFDKPFDAVLIKTMQETMKYLCENIQGCVFGYTQSDEITLILQDFKTFRTSAWFDYEVQKMCSIAASMCTMYFNKQFQINVEKEIFDYKSSMVPQSMELQEKHTRIINAYNTAIEKGAMFDCRVFNIPMEETVNGTYWRQLDAIRNSIQMVGQANFSAKELKNKSNNQIQEMLFTQKHINWNDFPIYLKRGSSCIKKEEQNGRSKWFIDLEMPELVGEGRKYLQDILDNIQEEK